MHWPAIILFVVSSVYLLYVVAGYPLLLGSGETANGTTPLIDRQHPHDRACPERGEIRDPRSRAGDGRHQQGSDRAAAREPMRDAKTE